MTRRRIELALRKQRLQLESDDLRAKLAQHGAGLAPAAAVVDGVHAGWHWLRAHPEVVVATATALAVLRPRLMWRWLRRGWGAWRAWRMWRVFANRLVIAGNTH